MQIGKIFLSVAVLVVIATSVLSSTPGVYMGGGYMAFILSPQVAYGVLSPVAIVGITGYLAAGRIDLVLSGAHGAAVLSPVLTKNPKNSAGWVVGAGSCVDSTGSACRRRELGLSVVDMVKEELQGQGIVTTFMMKGQAADNSNLNDPSKTRFGKMTKSFVSAETYARLQQYEMLTGIKQSTTSREDLPVAVIRETYGENAVCNVCGVEGEIKLVDGQTCVVRERCDASDNLPNPDGGIELPQVSIISFNLDAACQTEEGITTCLDEASIKATMLDTFGSTARISVSEASNYEFEDLYDPLDRQNLIKEENRRRLQSLQLGEFGSLEQCSTQNSYIVSAVFMDNEEFKTARVELGSETIEDDIATFLSADHDTLCGIKITPQFAYHIPAPNDPEFNKAVRPLEVSMAIPTIQIASDENGHEDILVRGESYRVIMDDFKTGETVIVNLVQVKEETNSEEVRVLKSIQNFSSANGPIEFDWTVGDLQPVGSYYFEATIKDIPVSYSSAFEILSA